MPNVFHELLAPLEVLFLSNEIEFERVGEAPSDRRRHPLLEPTKRKNYLFCQMKRRRHFVHKSNTNNVFLASPSISLDKNTTFIAGELSGITNTVLPETPVDFVRQKITLLAPSALRHYKWSASGAKSLCFSLAEPLETCRLGLKMA